MSHRHRIGWGLGLAGALSLCLIGAAVLKSWILDPALVDAAGQGDPAAAQALIRRGGNVNARGGYPHSDGWTPLMTAAWEGRASVLPALFAAKVDVNARDSRGWTALMLAAARGHREMVESLVFQGADVNACNEDGETVLMVAARAGSLPVTRFLLAHGADRRARDSKGETAAREAVLKGYPHVARILEPAD